MKNKPLFLIIGSLILLIGIFFMGARIFKNHEAQKLEGIAFEDFKTFVPAHAMRVGNSEAKVYVVEFFDPECEGCRAFHPHMDSIMRDYEGKIQLVYRYAPFHGNSIMAIKILESARKQNKYMEVLNVMFQYQPEWGSHHNPRPELLWHYLPASGVDIPKLRIEMEDPAIQALIKQDMEDGKLLNVRMTPTFFVNGKAVEYGPEFLRAAIDEALKTI